MVLLGDMSTASESTIVTSTDGGKEPGVHAGEESSGTTERSANQMLLDSLPNWLKPGVARETHM